MHIVIDVETDETDFTPVELPQFQLPSGELAREWSFSHAHVQYMVSVRALLQKKLEALKIQETERNRKIMNNNLKRKNREENRIVKSRKAAATQKLKQRELFLRERQQIVLWRKPFMTLKHFLFEIPCCLKDSWKQIVLSCESRRKMPVFQKLCLILCIICALYSLTLITLATDESSIQLKANLSWFAYWVFLGVLSSVGLGTGLHTFLLYLGPFIAKVTLAAQECGTLEFPRPPYPDQIVCPEGDDKDRVSIQDIMAKVRWECLMWGFGTALGELPPYFMARAARISGMDDDEELQEFNELLEKKQEQDPSTLGWLERGKLLMEDIVEKVGFWGILACASIPNPLFDLAGITCGHFLVPFTTFFGATVIGKAVIKVHLQMTFVILAFNEELLQSVVQLLGEIPRFGPVISEPFVKLIEHQKSSLHNRSDSDSSEGGLLGFLLDKIVMVMILYFVVSIVNSMAQSHFKRVSKEKERNSE